MIIVSHTPSFSTNQNAGFLIITSDINYYVRYLFTLFTYYILFIYIIYLQYLNYKHYLQYNTTCNTLLVFNIFMSYNNRVTLQLVAMCSKRLLVDSLLLTFRNFILTEWTVNGPSEYHMENQLFLGSYFSILKVSYILY